MIGNGKDINWTLVLVVIVAAIFVTFIVLLTIQLIKKHKNKKVEDNKEPFDNNKWVNALGGKENIKNLEAKGSRLVVYLYNNELVNKEELHNLGVTSVISSQDKITLVLKEKAENISNLLQ